MNCADIKKQTDSYTGGTGVRAVVDFNFSLLFCLPQAKETKYLKQDVFLFESCRFFSFGMKQMYIFAEETHHPQLQGNLRVITFLSARDNYKAGGEAGGGSTV